MCGRLKGNSGGGGKIMVGVLALSRYHQKFGSSSPAHEIVPIEPQTAVMNEDEDLAGRKEHQCVS